MALTETPLYSPVNHTASWEFIAPTQTPDAAYLAWATELGVSDSGSDVAFNLTGMTEVVTQGHFYEAEYAFANKIGVSYDGCFHFDISDPAATPTGQHTISDPGANEDYIVTPAGGASFGLQFKASYAFGGGKTAASQWSNLRCRSAAGVTIIRGKLYNSEIVNSYFDLAMRIEQDEIKVIYETQDRYNQAGGPYNKVRLIRWNAAADTIMDAFDIRVFPQDTNASLSEELNIQLVRRKIDGTITEAIAGEKFKVYANEYDTGRYVADVAVNTPVSTAYTLEFATSEPVILTARIDANKWEEATYAVGDQVYPTNPVTTPYYYKCTTGGASSSSEPTWPTSAGTVADGAAIWTFVERLVQPVAQAPVIPQLVV